MTLKLSDTMHDADFVVIDGVVFETGYIRVPDEFTVADDVVLEAHHGETELEFTRARQRAPRAGVATTRTVAAA